jgi:putative hydrolase of the HAD superfamily
MKKRKYRHIFFDLDNTIWDFEGSSNEALKMLYLHYKLEEKGIDSLENFRLKYHQFNNVLWALYREGGMAKEVLRSLRFKQTLEWFGISEPGLDEAMSDYYLHYAPRIVRLEPGAIETLTYLKDEYRMHLITNGFSEVQYTKISEGRLSQFFEKIITSEEAGVKKPNPAIFQLALQQAGAQPHESLMVGDDPEVDIEGARACGMDQVFYNPKSMPSVVEATYQIVKLDELKKIL